MNLTRRFAPVAFPVALALSAFAVGCGNTVENGDDDGAGGSGTGTGTDTGTGSGGDTATSTSSGQTCDEPVIQCPPGIGHACVDGEWECTYGTTIGSSSSGQNETCPESAPPPGSACSVEGMTCEVPSDMDCGPATIQITCIDGEWVRLTARCVPLLCRDVADAAECDAIGCRWLEPGCGDAPLAAAGCFDPAPCVEGACNFGDETCMNVSVVPACATEDPACDSCSEQLDVCVPQLVGEDDGEDGAG